MTIPLLLVGCGTSTNEESVLSKEENKNQKEESNKEKEKQNIETEEVQEDTNKDKKESEMKPKKEPQKESSPEKKEKPAFSFKTEPIKGYYTSKTALNVREKPNVSSNKIGIINVGNKIEVVEKTTNLDSVWFKVNLSGKEGWASSNYMENYEDYKKRIAEKEKAQSEKEENDKSNEQQTDSKLVVDTFKTLGNSQQVILVTNKQASSSNARIQAFDKSSGKWKKVYDFNGHVGKRGIGKASEGDAKSPEGKYSIGFAFGHGSKPSTSLPYRNITSDIVWVDDSNSKYYNTWQDKSKVNVDWNSAENMKINQYSRGFVINYNTNSVPGKGSAIFFHVNGNYGYTLGCTSASKANVERILAWINPSKAPVIIQTPESRLGNY